MEKRGLSLAEIQEVPRNNLILLAGPPGAGKSTFCRQVILNGIAAERPVIFVTTEQSPSGVMGLLKEKGMAEPVPLSFVDAFTETVGLTCMPRTDTVCANCADLNSLSIAITKLRERMKQKGILLAFDSLTSPYLFCGAEIARFIRLFLLKFAAEENSVLALIDEGCGKEEDLGAMMSAANGIIRMEVRERSRIVNVVKHPKVRPTRVEASVGSLEPERIGVKFLFDNNLWDSTALRQFIQGKAPLRKEVGDFVNLFWLNLAQWSGMLWDPKRFPRMKYDLNKEDACMVRQMLQFFPWQMRLLLKFMPGIISSVKDMKKMLNAFAPFGKKEGSGIIEYVDEVSKTDEHYIRVYESSDCWAFANVGVAMASYMPSNTTGMCQGFERGERDWNAIETKCIGLGDPYCEFKLVPGQINELKGSLEVIDSSIMERVHDMLMHRLTGFLLNGKPLVERPNLGSDISLHTVGHGFSFPYFAGERYQMALRMGGTKVGKEVGEHLINAGLGEDEAVKRVLHFLKHCKVGKVIAGETIRIYDNCESCYMKLVTIRAEQPSCYFTTGFLNGLYLAVKNQHVREIKCIAAGDPYCEWEII